MKVFGIVVVIWVLMSSPVMAEPYAEWGVFLNGKSLSEFGTGEKVPDASDVPIPAPPDGAFIGVSGNRRSCMMQIITERSIDEVCDFYKSILKAPEYQSVEGMGELLKVQEGCAIYKDGVTKQGVGVWVYKKERTMYLSGNTVVAVSYHAPSGKECGK